MRDPNRIDAFCARLAAAWKENCPDMRFGQFIMNAFGGLGKDPFFPEDDKMIEFIEKWAKNNSPYHKPPKTFYDVVIEKFPAANELWDGVGACMNTLFGKDTVDCDHFTGTCKECWLQPAPEEYQEDKQC